MSKKYVTITEMFEKKLSSKHIDISDPELVGDFTREDYQKAIALFRRLVKIEGCGFGDEEATKNYFKFRDIEDFLEKRNTLNRMFKKTEITKSK